MKRTSIARKVKRTKKSIYASYGVDFKSEKIFAPIFGWIPKFLPVGTNSKLGDGVSSFAIAHGNETYKKEDFKSEKIVAVFEMANIDEISGSCPMHCNDCYCDCGFYNMPSVKSGLIMKLVLVRFHLDFVKRAIMAQIEADSIAQCRIHASGDFFSNEYVDAWHEIASRFPNTIFWTYTKTEYAIERFSNLENLTIVPSITPMGINFGTTHELLDMYDALSSMGYRVHICACGTELEKHCGECKTGCKAVGRTCDFVLFIKHSTNSYTFKVDDTESDYERIMDIIRKQDN